MNSFFRIAVYFTFGMLFATLVGNLLFATGAFTSVHDEIGQQDLTEENVLSKITGLDNGMEGMWALVTVGTGAIALALSVFTHSLIPFGIYLFSEVFWTSYIHLSGLLSTTGYLPGDFLVIISIGMVFLFIAAVIGMLTGSG